MFESNEFFSPPLGEEINDCHYLDSLQVPGNLILGLVVWDGLKSRAPKVVRGPWENKGRELVVGSLPFVQEKKLEGQIKMPIRKVSLQLFSLCILRWCHLSVCCDFEGVCQCV